MRNLKKILALVLALVMSLSLMATASAAETTSADGDPYATAKAVLEGLEVFRGGDGGNMLYDTSLTRVQAAALVYRVATGDVTDSLAALHSNHPFNDIPNGYWGTPYISYGYVAGILKGDGAGNFNPDNPVTGYQFLAMIMRAMGYGQHGEFEGDAWYQHTADQAQALGLMDNVTVADQTAMTLGQNATRGLVAELLFRAVLEDMVQYNIVKQGYDPITPSKKLANNLKLTEVEGVITANEFASLTGNNPLSAGKTQLGDNRIDWTTGRDELGETRHAYLYDGKKVLSLDGEDLNATEVSTAKEKDLDRILDEAGISRGDAKHYINFNQWPVTIGPDSTTKIRIAYVMDMTYLIEDIDDNDEAADKLNEWAEDNGGFFFKDEDGDGKWSKNDKAAADGNEVTAAEVGNGYTFYYKSIKSGTKLEDIEFDMDNIVSIFRDAGKLDDYKSKEDDDDKAAVPAVVTGEVYVGTQDITDFSDNNSYSDFEDKCYYIPKPTEEIISVTANENGNWLKVIDNDGDGAADYILKIVYTAAQVARVANDGAVTLDVKDRDLSKETDTNRTGTDSRFNKLTNQKVVNMSDEDLARDDVVYYAVIDGLARTYKAPVRTATIDKMNRDDKGQGRSCTTTDGDEWFESGVHNHIVDDNYLDGVHELEGRTTYDLYFDCNDTLMAFVKTDLTSDFILITDGWFNSTKSGFEYAVRYYDDEAKKIVTSDDLVSGGNLFIGRDVENGIRETDNNDWLALKYLGGTSEGGSGTALRNPTSNPAALNGADGTTGTPKGNNMIKTAVAVLRDGNTLLPVESASARREYRMIDMNDNAIPSNVKTEGDVYVTTGNTAYNYTDSRSAEYDDVEVVATSRTLYYVVYPRTSPEDLGVDTYTGFSSVEDIEKLATDGVEIEDVYTVGTLHERDNEHGNEGGYYTADVVVIELNKAPVNSSRELALVVNDWGNTGDVNYRQLHIIRKDGTEDDIYVYVGTQTLSTRVDVNNITAGTNDRDAKIEPGLYDIEVTRYDYKGETLYQLYELTPGEISELPVVVGQITYENDLLGDKNVTVHPTTKTGNTITKADKWVLYTVTDDSMLYQLSYNVPFDGNYKRTEPTLKLGEAVDVLNGNVDEVSGTTSAAAKLRKDTETNGLEQGSTYTSRNDVWSYFYNDVLLYVDKGEIIWAVSFENAYSSTELDYAQKVWASDHIQPAPENELKDGAVRFNTGVKDEEIAPMALSDLAPFGDDYLIDVADLDLGEPYALDLADRTPAVATGSTGWTVDVLTRGEKTYLVLSKGDDATKNVTLNLTYLVSVAAESSAELTEEEIEEAGILDITSGGDTSGNGEPNTNEDSGKKIIDDLKLKKAPAGRTQVTSASSRLLDVEDASFNLKIGDSVLVTFKVLEGYEINEITVGEDSVRVQADTDDDPEDGEAPYQAVSFEFAEVGMSVVIAATKAAADADGVGAATLVDQAGYWNDLDGNVTVTAKVDAEDPNVVNVTLEGETYNHLNADMPQKMGWWAGFEVKAPDGAVKFQYKKTNDTEWKPAQPASLEPIHDGERGVNYWFDANQTTEGTFTVKWIGDNGDLSEVTYNFTSEVECKDEAKGVTKGNPTDRTEESPLTTVIDDFAAEAVYTNANTVSVTLTGENLKEHQNGDNPANRGHWVGVILQAPTGATKAQYALNSNDELNSNRETTPYDMGDGTKGFGYYFSLTDVMDGETVKKPAQSEATIKIQWFNGDNKIGNVITYKIDASGVKMAAASAE